MAILREAWIDILIYIDDTFLRAPTSQQLLCNLKYTQMLFEKCGLTINLDKSCLSPTTRMEFLGFVLDSIDFTISITAHKRRSLRHLLEPIVAHPLQKIHIKKIAKIIGIIVSFFPASDKARLHYRILERYKTHQVSEHKSWKFHLRLDRQCIAEINWWYELLERDMTKSLRKRDPTVTIFTDSSKIGFGSVWNGEELQGQFTEKQKMLSINTKELLAIYYTISTYASRLRGQAVHLKCDNMTAISCVRSFGSSDVLRDWITQKLYHLAHSYNFSLDISYVQSKQNLSDRPSRVFKGKSVHSEWSLQKSDFDKCMAAANFRPDVDMFASVQNAKLPKYITWGPCPTAVHVDAFTLCWKEMKGFIFPPFYCVSSVIKKCLDNEIENVWHFSDVAHQTLVAKPDALMRRPVHNPKQSKAHPAMGRNDLSSHGKSADPDFCQFVYELLLKRKVQKSQAAHISQNAWRERMLQEKKRILACWFSFAEKSKINVHDLSFSNILAFLEDLCGSKQTYSWVKRGRSLMSVLRQIIDDPLTPANNFLLDKLSSASFNLNPPKILKPTSTWDVNILSDHFVQMGPNEKFKSVNRLGGKLMLQLLLTQM